MASVYKFSGQTEAEIWEHLGKALKYEDGVPGYQAIIQQGDKIIYLDIDIDPGGGFENGDASTSFRSEINAKDGYRLVVYTDTIIADIGKLFGMQDMAIGFPEFDKKVIIKTNNEERTKQIFASYEVREAFQSLDNFSLEITDEHDMKDSHLLLDIEEGITDPERLKILYHAFLHILQSIETNTTENKKELHI